MKDRLNTKNPIRQRESSFNFLAKLGKDYRVFFHLSHKPDGKKIGIFIDTTKSQGVSVKKFIQSTIKVNEDEKQLFYNSGQFSNVSSYTWQQHIGESGQGDMITTRLINGVTVFERRVMENGKVKLWRLNTDKIDSELGKQATEAQRTKLLNLAKDSTDFQQVINYFDPVNETTAPQGMGYTVNCSVHGDPLLTPFMKIIFKSGFPQPLTQSNQALALIKFIIKRITHSFSKAEYKCDLEIVDSYTLMGSYMNLQQGDLTPKK
jgi:hypothetical protein